MTDPREGVRTYKPRRGRMGATATATLERLRDPFGLPDGPVDPVALFGRGAPLVLEIGSGMGEATLVMAAADPDRDVLAFEVHTPGVAALLAGCERAGLTNVRVAEADALTVLAGRVAPATVDEIRVFFPDPWPKARHAKRRLVSPGFADLVGRLLRPGGRLHVATDDAAYADGALAALAGCSLLAVGPVPRPEHRPVTRFEQRALDVGREVVDLVAVRLGPGAGADFTET